MIGLDGIDTTAFSPFTVGSLSTSNNVLLQPPSKPYISGIIEGFYGSPWTTMQRRHLLRMLSQLGMNTYVYAPKDDNKHREKWRVKYETEEAAELQSLIEFARAMGINFVYALSPGGDVEYSNAKDVTAIKDKLDQLRSIGCNAFALLFDDIEYKLSDTDISQYGTPANAQVAVANDCYSYLNSPTHFYFCPTEYCSTRAKPNLLESDYLRTIGDRLHPGIDIFWTGPLVVPSVITVDHAKAVAMVMKRKPLIWDNYYANDYDTRRLHMGPFCGRPVALRQEVSGLLLNPNNQYEMNNVPIHTFNDWMHSTIDLEDIKDDDSVMDEPETNTFIYDGEASAKKHTLLWLREFNLLMSAIPYPRPIRPEQDAMDMPPPSPLANLHVLGEAIAVDEGSPQMPTSSKRPEKEEPMDRSPSMESDVSMCDSVRGNGVSDNSILTIDQLTALIHSYYCPFSFGDTAKEILSTFVWLYRQAHTMSAEYEDEASRSRKSSSNSGRESPVVERVRGLWNEEHQRIIASIDLILHAFRFLHHNKALQISGTSVDLVRYAYNAHCSMIMMRAALEWLKAGNLHSIPEPRFKRWEKATEGLEAWYAYHSICEDMAWAMLPDDPAVAFVLLFKNKVDREREADPLTITEMNVRALVDKDLTRIDHLTRTIQGLTTSPEDVKTMIDKYYRPFLENSNNFHFVCEEIDLTGSKEIIASVCGIRDLMHYYEERSFRDIEGMPTDNQIVLPPLPSQSAFVHFNSYFDLRARCDETDTEAARRLLQLIGIIFAFDGATGMYTAVEPHEQEKVKLLLDCHFIELASSSEKILLAMPFKEPENFSSDSDDEDFDGNPLNEEDEEPVKQRSVEEEGRDALDDKLEQISS